MKKLLALSFVVNVVFVGSLWWMHRAQERDLWRLAEIAARGDETHIKIHGKSLAALESDDPVEVEEVKTLLRHLVQAGERNAAWREEWKAAGGGGLLDLGER
jgi:hypothetical protein